MDIGKSRDHDSQRMTHIHTVLLPCIPTFEAFEETDSGRIYNEDVANIVTLDVQRFLDFPLV
jgi:hypothetical protein